LLQVWNDGKRQSEKSDGCSVARLLSYRFWAFLFRDVGKRHTPPLTHISYSSILINFFYLSDFFIISPVWAYYDAKSYNREWGYGDFGEKVTLEDEEEAEEETDEGVDGETEKPNFCPNCGKPLLQDDNFCSRCGKST